MVKYRVYKNGESMGVLTRIQTCRMLCISSETFRKYADSGKLYQGKYRIEEIEEEQTNSNKNLKKLILAEWDKARFAVNPRANGWEQVR